MGEVGPRQHRRRLLRHDAEAYRRHRRGGEALPAARCPDGDTGHAIGRHRPDDLGGLTGMNSMRTSALAVAASEDADAVTAPAVATFVNIGERTNVTGSAKFKKLVMAGD